MLRSWRRWVRPSAFSFSSVRLDPAGRIVTIRPPRRSMLSGAWVSGGCPSTTHHSPTHHSPVTARKAIMTRPQTPVPTERTRSSERRSGANWAAFLLGLPLAAGLLGLFYFGPLRDSPARRYVSHPVECVELVMFCGALAALGVKLLGSLLERRSCRRAILPPWDGHAVPVSEARKLLGGLNQFPKRLQNSQIAKRTAAVLHFLCSRGSAAELDDHLRSLADTDALALEGSYAL